MINPAIIVLPLIQWELTWAHPPSLKEDCDQYKSAVQYLLPSLPDHRNPMVLLGSMINLYPATGPFSTATLDQAVAAVNAEWENLKLLKWPCKECIFHKEILQAIVLEMQLGKTPHEAIKLVIPHYPDIICPLIKKATRAADLREEYCGITTRMGKLIGLSGRNKNTFSGLFGQGGTAPERMEPVFSVHKE